VSRRRKGLGRRLFLVFYFAEAVVLARELHRRGLRHVHVHHANNAAIVAMLAARYLRVGYSLTAHGSDVLLERDLLEDKLRHAAFAVAVSEYNRAAMLSCGISPDSPPIHVVHTGVELDRFAPGEARPPHDLDLLSVGRLHEVKAFPDLLRACHRLTRDGLVFRCRIVGDGPSRARLERLRDELGLEDRVEFVGPVGHDELPGYYRESDVFVMASRSEGIPVVLMEAMACGLPVVATDITGIPELVEHGKSGLLVPPGDPDRLARAVAELAASAEKRREYGNAGRRRVRERFDVREGARRLDRLFRERLAEGRDRSGA
jgi:glycosyltransferase involved in cell wall biosynthesis